MFKQDPTCSVGLPWQSGTLRTSDWYWARLDPLPFGAPSPPVGGWPRCGLRVSLRGLHVGRGRRRHRRQSARFRRRSKLCVEARLKTLKRKVHSNEIFFSWLSHKSSINSGTIFWTIILDCTYFGTIFFDGSNSWFYRLKMIWICIWRLAKYLILW